MTIQKPLINVAIFGSCVSREIFEAAKSNIYDYCVTKYVARTTVISSLSPPINVDTNMMSDTKFDDRRVLQDFRKEHFSILSASRADILVLDLVDERHNLARIDHSYACRSKAFLKQVEAALPGKRFPHISCVSDEIFSKTMEKLPLFCNKIKALNIPVILHRAGWVDPYIDDKGELRHYSETHPEEFAHDTKMNKFVTAYYDQVQKILGESCIAMSVPNSVKIAGGNTRFGLSSMHYDSMYYRALHTSLDNIIKKLRVSKDEMSLLNNKV